MNARTELRAFKTVVGAILCIPLVAGAVGAFGGVEGLALLLGEDRSVVLAPALRNHLRAICWMFFMLVPLGVWTLTSLEARAGAFRIVIGCAMFAGVVRIIGRFMDGPPGVAATVFTAIELAVLPVMLLWHTRLVRRAARAAP